MGKINRLVIFGRQGAGKGTQCLHLVKHLGVIHFSTGDALRKAVSDGTDLGREVKSAMDRGDLIDDDLMIRLVTDRLSQPDIVSSGCILDGFPRTVRQAEVLMKLIASGEIPGGPLHSVIHLNVPLEEVTRRMMDRARSDDTADAIASRLALFEQETIPVLEWFEQQGLLQEVDGLGSEDEVTKRLLQTIEAGR